MTKLDSTTAMTTDTMRAAVGASLEALEIGRDAAASELIHRQEAYAGYPHKWAAEQEDLAKIDSALSLLRAALEEPSEPEKMRAEFVAWVQDRGCDTDGAWSAWQAAWNRRTPALAALEEGGEPRQIEDCPELNLSNYDSVDVDRLNDWAVRADAEIERLTKPAAVPIGARDGMDGGKQK